MTSGISEEGGQVWVPPRKANECGAGISGAGPRELLFDEFWREGELAMMFGPAGAGKSLLAVQLGDTIARGRDIEGFRMEAGRRKVLYVDLALGDAQFFSRYSRSRKSLHRFSENFYRGRPQSANDLCDWVEAAVAEGGFRVVIIDDLGAVKSTHDGTRETLPVMRRLKRLTEETGVSVLVLACSETAARERIVSERDLWRSRVLCTAADSVFAIGPKRGGKAGERYIIQTRSRNALQFSAPNSAPPARIGETESGMIGLVFEGPSAADMDAITQNHIRFVKAGRDHGMTFKAIAKELKIPKTRAVRLLKLWTPALGELDFIDDDYDDEEDYENYDYDCDHVDCDDPDCPNLRWGAQAGAQDPDAAAAQNAAPSSAEPILAGPQRLTVYDLKHGTDAYGRPIYIAKQDERGKPTVWYQFQDGTKLRYRRTFNGGINIDRLDTSEFL